MTSTVNTKNDICNLAVGRLGNYPSVNNIDIPKTTIETTFATFYDTVRQELLKISMPNFAMARRTVGMLTTPPAFGWAYAYEYPVDCLKLMGIGSVMFKRNDYAVEGNQILTNYAPNATLDSSATAGLNIRFIQDIDDVNAMTPEFKMLFSLYLAEAVCLPITQSTDKQGKLTSLLPAKLASASAINAQENRPIRISRSRYKEARYSNNPRNQTKY